MAFIANTLTAATVIISTLSAQPAFGSDFTILQPKPTAKLKSIGTIPPKRKKELDLGPLRTASAVLPAGGRTLQERMQMRVNSALDRKEAVSNALRNDAE